MKNFLKNLPIQKFEKAKKVLFEKGELSCMEQHIARSIQIQKRGNSLLLEQNVVAPGQTISWLWNNSISLENILKICFQEILNSDFVGNYKVIELDGVKYSIKFYKNETSHIMRVSFLKN